MGARAVKADFVAENVLIIVRLSSGDTVVRRFSSTMTTSRHGRSLHAKKVVFFFLEAATRCPARTRPIASRSAVAAPDATSTRAPRWAAITASAVTGPREPSSTPGGTAGHGRSPAPRGGGVGGTRGAATGVGVQQRRDGGEGQVGPVWGGSTMVAAVTQLLLQL